MGTMRVCRVGVAVIGMAALLLTACASEGSRQEGPRRGPGDEGPEPAPRIASEVFFFLPYDLDHNHRISTTERDAAIAGAWEQLAKGRGEVGLIELRDWVESLQGGASAENFGPLEFDPAGGGTVTRARFSNVLMKRFERLDINQDGVLEASEFTTVSHLRRDRSGSERHGPGATRRREPVGG